jgi:protein gp37
MAETTGIQWCDATFNPWRGCTKVSPGCANCYAEVTSKRNPNVLGSWGPGGKRIVAAASYWRQPLKWNRDGLPCTCGADRTGPSAEAQDADCPAKRRPRVFCASLADVFEDRPELVEPRLRLWETIVQTPNLDWLLLTKRPENFAELYPPAWTKKIPPNIWLGVSVEDQQRADERIPILLQTPAKVRFLSVEPLLGPVNLIRWLTPFHGSHAKHNGVDWVIVGGESGSHARPCDVEWIRSIRDQCKAAGVACFIKQLGAKPYEGLSVPVRLKDKKGGNVAEWPKPLAVRQFPA